MDIDKYFTLDRCLIIIQKHKYENCISKSRVIVLAMALLVFEAGRSFVYVPIDANMRLRYQCLHIFLSSGTNFTTVDKSDCFCNIRKTDTIPAVNESKNKILLDDIFSLPK